MNCQYCYSKNEELIYKMDERTTSRIYLLLDKKNLIVKFNSPIGFEMKEEIKVKYCPFCGKLI